VVRVRRNHPGEVGQVGCRQVEPKYGPSLFRPRSASDSGPAPSRPPPGLDRDSRCAREVDADRDRVGDRPDRGSPGCADPPRPRCRRPAPIGHHPRLVHVATPRPAKSEPQFARLASRADNDPILLRQFLARLRFALPCPRIGSAPPRRIVDSPSPPTFRKHLKKFMQLASPFCRSYRCKALTRGMRNHWLGSSFDGRVATIPSTPKVAIRCRLSEKEVGHSSFRLHFSSFPQAVSSLTFDHAKPRSAHLKPDCDDSFDGSIML